MSKPISASISVLFIVIAILFVMAVAAEVFVDDMLHPRTLFTYLLLSAVISGLATSIVVEGMDIRLFRNIGN